MVRTRWARSRSPSRRAILNEDELNIAIRLSEHEQLRPGLGVRPPRDEEEPKMQRKVTIGDSCEILECPDELVDDELRDKAATGRLRTCSWMRNPGRPVTAGGRSRVEATIVGLIQEAFARRDAGILANEMGRRVTGCWSVVWGTNGEAFVFYPRPDEDILVDEKGFRAEEPPYVMRREDAITSLDKYWESFSHYGEIPGLVERTDNGSKLTWARCPFWDGSASAPAVSGNRPSETVGTAKNTRWLIDSGCGWDLVDQRNVAHMLGARQQIRSGPKLWTANGIVQPDSKVMIHIPVLDDNYTPLVMQDSPDVLSLGRRCMDEGYSFRWDAKGPTRPYLVTPQGTVVMLRVDHYCPYLDVSANWACPAFEPDSAGARALESRMGVEGPRA